MRDVRVFFDSDNIDYGEPDRIIGAWYPTHSIGEYMAEVWPWLSYEYIDEMPECSGNVDVEAHKINVTLNAIGKAFLTLEDYYANGAEVIEPYIPVEEYEFDLDAAEYYESMREAEEEGADSKTDDKDIPF